VTSQVKRSWIAIAVIVVVVVGAFVVNRATAKTTTNATPNRAELIARADLPPCPTTSGSAPADGGLPSLTLPCLGNGPKVDLAKLKGPMVVNIWAGPCPPCRAEAPLLAQFAAKAAGKVAVLGVVDGAYSGETWDDALDASRGLALHYPSLFDAHGKFVDWVRSGGIPVSLFIDSHGKVAYKNIGPVRQGQLATLVKQYLGVDVAS
jgi:cytochrome c biogenesis protein CcmG, thiol:disulfide interchange protein DsbE